MVFSKKIGEQSYGEILHKVKGSFMDWMGIFRQSCANILRENSSLAASISAVNHSQQWCCSYAGDNNS
jgi:hypothetical protein